MADGMTEPYWHVRVSPVGSERESDDAVVVDRDRDWVERRILEKRRAGEPIALEGRVFEWHEVGQLKISVSDAPSPQLIQQIRAADAASSVMFFHSVGYEWRAASSARDVTDELIEGPPGTSTESGPAPVRVDSTSVMVVHGRDSSARRAMFDFLRALELRPLEWSNLVAQTGSAAPYVGEILDAAFEWAAAVVVLFTPDEEAKLRDPFLETGDPDYERTLTPQARPNVLFEAGMALGLHPDRTVLV